MRLWQSAEKQGAIVRAYRSIFNSNAVRRFVSLFVVGATLSLTIAACGGGGNNSTLR